MSYINVFFYHDTKTLLFYKVSTVRQINRVEKVECTEFLAALGVRVILEQRNATRIKEHVRNCLFQPEK